MAPTKRKRRSGTDVPDSPTPAGDALRQFKRRKKTMPVTLEVLCTGCSAIANKISPSCECPTDYLSSLSMEMLCHMLSYLPLRDIMKLDSLSHWLRQAVTMYLRLAVKINLTEGKIYGWMPTSFCDRTFAKFLNRCNEVNYIYGLHPKQLARRAQRVAGNCLTVSGILQALSRRPKLKGIETCSIALLQAIIEDLPHVEIIGMFKNRDSFFPAPLSNRIDLGSGALRVTSLHLSGVVVPRLPRMDIVRHLHLRWVRFEDLEPFQDFVVSRLRTFVMRHCAGPTNPLKYVSLVTGLATAVQLCRLELVRVPFLGGLMQHVVEDSWKLNGFRMLQKIQLGACKHALEVDLGYLIVTCSQRLEELAIQPSLTKDSLFSSINLAEVDFLHFHTLNIGFVDEFPERGRWTSEELVKHGLFDVTENPAMISDLGMLAASQAFPTTKSLTVSNCPHLHYPTGWFKPGFPSWTFLRDLTLCRCHAIRLADFCGMLPQMPSLQYLQLEQMFREPPKGCSRVGLSAGTGLGVSSALVSNAGGEELANQDAANNAPAPPPVPVLANDDAAPPPVNHNNNEIANNNNNAVPNEIANHQPAVEDDDNGLPGVLNADDPIDQVDEYLDMVNDMFCETAEDNDSEISSENEHSEKEDLFMDFKCDNDMLELEAKDIKVKTDNVIVEPIPCETNERESSVDACKNVRSSDTSKCDDLNCIDSSSDHEKSDDNSGANSDDLSTESNQPSSDAKSSDKGTETITSPITSTVACCPNCGKNVTIVTGPNGTSEVTKGDESDKDEKLNDTEDGNVLGLIDDGEKPGPSSNNPPKPRPRRPSANMNTNTGALRINTPSSELLTTSNLMTTEQRIPKPYTGKGKGGKGGKKSGKGSSQINQSCQAVSEEIRESTKKAKQSDTEDDSGTDHEVEVGSPGPATAHENPNKTPNSGVSTVSNSNASGNSGLRIGSPVRSAHVPDNDSVASRVASSRRTVTAVRRQQQQTSRKPNMCDQATSTSDPVIEEDHVQILSIRSQSLTTLILRQVGVTNITLQDCPKLATFSASACRTLKQVTCTSAPDLQRVSFAQCAKLDQDQVLQNLCQQTTEKDLIVYLRPMTKTYNVESMRNTLLEGTRGCKYNVGLMHNYCTNPESTVEERMRCVSWLSLLQQITEHYDALCGDLKLEERRRQDSYPWFRDIYMLQGEYTSGSKWDMICDFPWLRDLVEQQLKGVLADSHYKCTSQTSLPAGLDMLGMYANISSTECIRTLQEVLAEAISLKQHIYKHSLLVHVTLSDLNKQPTNDKYI